MGVCALARGRLIDLYRRFSSSFFPARLPLFGMQLQKKLLLCECFFSSPVLYCCFLLLYSIYYICQSLGLVDWKKAASRTVINSIEKCYFHHHHSPEGGHRSFLYRVPFYPINDPAKVVGDGAENKKKKSAGKNEKTPFH